MQLQNLAWFLRCIGVVISLLCINLLLLHEDGLKLQRERLLHLELTVVTRIVVVIRRLSATLLLLSCGVGTDDARNVFEEALENPICEVGRNGLANAVETRLVDGVECLKDVALRPYEVL